MLKLVSIDNSYKKILAHSISINGNKLNKCKIIEKSDIKLLNNIGKKNVYIFEKTPEHIGEDKASLQISKHIIGKNIIIQLTAKTSPNNIFIENKIPTYVATPLPPLNLSHIGNT